MSEAQLLRAPDTQSAPPGSDQSWQRHLQTAAVYIGTIFLCLLAVYFVMNLRLADWTIPQYGGSDTTFYMMGVKNLVENGGWYTNRFLGAPGQLELYDFPSLYGFNHLLVMKFLTLFSGNYVVVMNLYFLLSFPLAGISSLFVLRQFKSPIRRPSWQACCMHSFLITSGAVRIISCCRSITSSRLQCWWYCGSSKAKNCFGFGVRRGNGL